jgi:hypothetical protein
MSYTNGLDKPTDYFNTITYTGDDVDGRTITGVGFQSDFSWVKARSSAFSHYIIDAIRYDSGASKYLKLDSSYNGGDETPSGAGWISALNSDGYVCKNGTSNTNNCNENGVTYVAWNWLGANGTASNTDGSITSTVSANTTSGFSIVSYTGTGANATVGHGLNSPAKFIILKRRDATNDWEIGSDALGWDKHLYFTTGAANSSSDRWQNTAPTNSVFYIQTAAGNNASSSPFIAYCFAEKKGFSKFGSYTGNGSTDGTFVYTGFKPAFLITKCTSNSAFSNSNWMLYDNKRDLYNQMAEYLYPDSSNASGTNSQGMDFLSNGIKMRNTFGDANYNNETYIYMAFAENPFVTSTGIPTTAR